MRVMVQVCRQVRRQVLDYPNVGSVTISERRLRRRVRDGQTHPGTIRQLHSGRQPDRPVFDFDRPSHGLWFAHRPGKCNAAFALGTGTPGEPLRAGQAGILPGLRTETKSPRSQAGRAADAEPERCIL
jgi:hypothetical protein